MEPFRHAAALADDWNIAAGRVADLLSRADAPVQAIEPGATEPLAGDRLGIFYVTDPLADSLQEITELLGARLPGVQWLGAAAHGVCSTGLEVQDRGAIAAMMGTFPKASFDLFAARNRFDAGAPDPQAHAALVHADPSAERLNEMLAELNARLGPGPVFGGVVGGEREPTRQLAGGLVTGGLSGVTFRSPVELRSRVTQGCSPLAREHVVSASSAQFIQALDGRPALDVLLDDLGVEPEIRRSRDGDEILRALPMRRLARGLMVGFAPAGSSAGRGFGDYAVRNVVGIDPVNRLLAVAGAPQAGERAVFCTRNEEAARADLIRICTELRDELETESLVPLGAHFVSCVARGEHLFGSQGAEQKVIAHNLGEIPLVGFYANGEIAGDRLYGYTGVLTLFVAQRSASGIV